MKHLAIPMTLYDGVSFFYLDKLNKQFDFRYLSLRIFINSNMKYCKLKLILFFHFSKEHLTIPRGDYKKIFFWMKNSTPSLTNDKDKYDLMPKNKDKIYIYKRKHEQKKK